MRCPTAQRKAVHTPTALGAAQWSATALSTHSPDHIVGDAGVDEPLLQLLDLRRLPKLLRPRQCRQQCRTTLRRTQIAASKRAAPIDLLPMQPTTVASAEHPDPTRTGAAWYAAWALLCATLLAQSYAHAHVMARAAAKLNDAAARG